jgi:hypothetical protein
LDDTISIKEGLIPLFMPKTCLGKGFLGLIAAFFLFFAMTQILEVSSQRGRETFFSNLLLAIVVSLAGISAISAFFTGIISIIKRKERSILVFWGTVIRFFVLSFVLGEFLFPH